MITHLEEGSRTKILSNLKYQQFTKIMYAIIIQVSRIGTGFMKQFHLTCHPSGVNCFIKLGAVALTVGSVPRRIVPELRHCHWLLKMNNQSNSCTSKTILCGTDPTVSRLQRPPGFR